MYISCLWLYRLFSFKRNPNANTDDGTCISHVYGCTDSLALNYNPNANTDNGTCISPVYGCTDENAENYNPDANVYDFSCIFSFVGCTDSLAINYDPIAQQDDETCIYCNLQIEYTVQNASLTTAGNISFNISGVSNNYSSTVFLNGEVQNPDHLHASDYILVIKDFTTGCDSVIYFSVLQELDDLNYGCIDTLACNFDLSATQDNGSCVYASPGYDCDSNCVAQDIDWIGDQAEDGFITFDPTTNLPHIIIESYPNVGIASISINGNVQPMNYYTPGWGNTAYWYVSLDLTPSNVYIGQWKLLICALPLKPSLTHLQPIVKM